MQPSVLDTAQAAAYIGLSRQTLANRRVGGGSPPYVKIGRAVRYRVADLDSWLAARVVTSTSQQVPA